MATLSLVPLTELDAVNVMLELMGESPADAISEDMPETEIAQSILHRTSREVQSEGWSFNKDEKYTWTRENDDTVLLTNDVLYVDGYYPWQDYVQRGTALYDRYNQSYTFDTDPVLNVVWFMDFTDLPSYAREYITIMAARRFLKRVLGSEGLDNLSQEDEARARTLFISREMATSDANLLNGPDQWRMRLNRFRRA